MPNELSLAQVNQTRQPGSRPCGTG